MHACTHAHEHTCVCIHTSDIVKEMHSTLLLALGGSLKFVGL